MSKQRLRIRHQIFQYCIIASLLAFPLTLHASLIEATIGTAVVNDATATYYNPAALTLVKTPQAIALGSLAYFNTKFTGQLTLPAIGFKQFGSSNTHTHYFLPSFYFGLPHSNKIAIGIAIISNYFHKDISDDSFLRFFQSSDNVTNIDLVAAIGVKLNDYFSLGASLNLTAVDLLFEPIAKFPNLNTEENKSHNESHGYSWQGDIGCLLKLSKTTVVGFNYRNAVCYQLSGTSTLQSNPQIFSDNYRFKFWTPARSVLSINQNVTTSLGFIGTVQYIQWNVLDAMTFHNLATVIGSQALILPNVKVPFHLRNTWLLTLGSHYRIKTPWVIRAAATYNQSPGNAFYQITAGDSLILGMSSGYDISKCFSIDVGYAHAFIKNKTINLMRSGNIVNGINQASRNAFSLKLIFNG